MTEEQYKKLNNYLNDIFIELEKNNSFLLRNIYPIAKLSDMYLNATENIELDDNTIQNNISFLDVMSLSREIIASIDTNYLKDFDKLIETGEIDFSYNNEYYDDFFRLFVNKNKKIINLNRKFNYSDVRVLIHEFIHYTNSGIHINHCNSLLTEFLSIYFEQYAIDYMINKGIDKKEIDYNGRYISTKIKSNNLCNYAVVLLSYENFGNIDKNSWQLLNDKFIPINEKKFNKICLRTLEILDIKQDNYKFDVLYQKEFNEQEKNKEILNLLSSEYCYILGTIFATYALEYCDINKIIELNNSASGNNLINSNIFAIFKSMGIDIDSSSFNNNIFDCIQRRLSKYNKVRK